VLYGSPSGLTTAGSQFWSQAGPIQGSPAPAHEFGFSLAAGDFNGDGRTDLGVGVPGQEVSGHAQAGASIVIYGSSSGLTAVGNQMWSLDSPGIFGRAEEADRCGFSLTAADFGRGSQADLAMGVPGEDIKYAKDAGGVSVIYGSPSGLAPAGNQYWHQGIHGIIGRAFPGDQFGYSLGP
jgi:hypothetical protein